MDEIAAFLRSCPPFDQLPPAAVALAAAEAEVESFAVGSDLLSRGGDQARFLYVIREGSVNLLYADGGAPQVFDSLGPGEAFGHPALIRDLPPDVTIRAASDVLAYLIPAATFHRLRAEHAPFAAYFAGSALDRLAFAARSRDGDATSSFFRTRLQSLVRRAVVAVRPETSVHEAARLMSEQSITCLIVDLPPYGVHGAESGIITDRDLRKRVLARGLPLTTTVGEAMTAPALTLPADSLVFEALLLMLERDIHHLPVTDQGRVIGVITQTDILRRQSRSPLFLPRLLERAEDLDDLRSYGDQVSDAVAGLLDAGARVSDIGRVVAVAHDALLQRILRDAEARLGAPPAPYAWLVLGSEGRYEQTLRTDQDNALIYADDHPPAAPEYFRALAELVVEHLVACGFPRCPGEIMATNPRWRQPLAAWQGLFARWIDVPDEEALLRSTIFFDYRQAYGQLEVEPALRPVIARARGNTIFLGRLARTALRASAPLNFFGGVAVERRGEQKDLLDLKHRGTALIVDLARIYALEAGRAETSTVTRLRTAWRSTSLSEVEAENLVSAFELLSLLRLRHQRLQIARGEEPTNLVVYPQLTPVEQRELKTAFQTVARAQRALSMVYRTDLMG